VAHAGTRLAGLDEDMGDPSSGTAALQCRSERLHLLDRKPADEGHH